MRYSWETLSAFCLFILNHYFYNRNYGFSNFELLKNQSLLETKNIIFGFIILLLFAIFVSNVLSYYRGLLSQDISPKRF